MDCVNTMYILVPKVEKRTLVLKERYFFNMFSLPLTRTSIVEEYARKLATFDGRAHLE
jgi:hypothetical protein